MNPGLEYLQAYPFERLAEIRASAAPAAHLEPINMSIGEPRHPTPQFIHEALTQSISTTGKYPPTRGSEALRGAIAQWLTHRFKIPAGAIDPERHVLPVNGTREALFSIAQCVVDPRTPTPTVAMPNPFYQIYEGAALLAGAQPYYVPCPAQNGFLPALELVPSKTWRDCQILFICTPGNPSGKVMPAQQLATLLELADRYDFIIVSDECYCELYLDEHNPPVGLLQVAWEQGRTDFHRCIVMHSLSKRSNAPGLRSGFAAGDASLLSAYLRYRTYHGCAMPLYVQAASAAAWMDEAHVKENRKQYRDKFEAVLPMLTPFAEVPEPEAGFYLWPRIAMDDVECCRRLIEEQNVTTLPGRFLARQDQTGNPGQNRIRIVLADEIGACVEGARRIAALLEQHAAELA
ncbi:MAG TPA: succinyldiaminopimelate transaminase [Gammaproteobacteria bacterium]|jgi:N-succinyldiaminopimelate aminotransferase|nr:succinyldiaminopimelate transaminase [Gammaproteobacteria bacterium]